MPKTRDFSFVVPGRPEEVAQRLERQTRFRLFPHQGSFLVRSDRPLAGRVSASGFAVAVNRRDWLTLTQAVAKGELRAEGDSTRVEGSAGLPPALTWALRFATVLAVALGLVGVVAGATGGPTEAVLASLLMSAAVFAGVLGIGLNVNNADEQVPELLSRLEATLREPTPAIDEAHERARRAQAARQREG